MGQKKEVAKSAFSMGILTILSKFFGLARDMLIAATLGTTMYADAFAQAFRLPNLLRRFFAEGAFTSGFIPVFSELKAKNQKKEMNLFISRLFILQTITLLLVVIVGIVFAPFIVNLFFKGFAKVQGKIELTISLTRLMFGYIFFISLAAICQGVLNSHKIFSIPAATPILLNISIITCAFIFRGQFANETYPFAIGVLIGGFLQFASQIPFLKKTGFTFLFTTKIFDKKVIKALTLMVPVIVSGGIYQINIVISQNIASYLPNGQVIALDYSYRLIEIVLGAFAVSLATVVLPVLSDSVANNKQEEVEDIIIFSLKLTALVAIPATVGLFILRYDIVSLIYQRYSFSEESVKLVATALAYHSFGLLFIAIYRILVRYFYAHKDMKTPLIVSLISVVINIALCYYLAPILQLGGIALAITVSSAVSSLMLLTIIKLRANISYFQVYLTGVKVIIASFVMGLSLAYFKQLVSGKIWTLPLVAVGGIIYSLAILILMKKEVILLIQKFKTRGKKI
jgi:putative peptidoglycan lipid II flippase